MLEIFKALSDENRLRILHLLFHKELCVCELEVLLDMSQSNVSRHLNKLKSPGLIGTVKSGLWAHYRLNETFFEENQGLFSYLKINWDGEALFKEDLRRLNSYLTHELSCKDIAEDKTAVTKILKGGTGK